LRQLFFILSEHQFQRISEKIGMMKQRGSSFRFDEVI